MEVKTSKNIHLGAFDNVEQPIREAPQDGTSHVAIYALVEPRIGFEMSLNTRKLIEEVAAAVLPLRFVVSVASPISAAAL